MTKQLSHKLYFWVNCTNLFRHRLFSNYLDELVVLLAGEVGLLGLVILARDDHRDPGDPAAPTHTHVHCNPGLKIKSWCPMMTHELFVMTSNFLIQETANWQLWHYMLELLSEPKILTWRNKIRKIYKICLHIELVCHKRKCRNICQYYLSCLLSLFLIYLILPRVIV